jgi:hypothetical protein
MRIAVEFRHPSWHHEAVFRGRRGGCDNRRAGLLSTNLSTNQSYLVPFMQLWSRGLTLRSLLAERAPG